MNAEEPKKVTVAYLSCRDMRHAWEPSGDAVLLEKKGLVKRFSRRLTCLRCGTMREDVYQLAGHAVLHEGTRYSYPQGYRVKGGLKVSAARWLLFRDAEMRTSVDTD